MQVGPWWDTDLEGRERERERGREREREKRAEKRKLKWEGRIEWSMIATTD